MRVSVRLVMWVAAIAGLYSAQQLLWPAPAGVVAQGVLLGLLTSLTALGIALVYRANRIINFAQGDLGGAPATLAVLLIAGAGFSFWLAMIAGLLAAVVLGALVEFLLIRRFFRAPRLIVTVATIGVAQVLAGLELLLSWVFGVKVVPRSLPAPFDVTVTIDPVVFHGGAVLAVIVVPLAIAGLLLFLRYTAVGIAVRASAESAERAALLGVPVKRLHTVVWIVATVLSTVAMLLRAGIVGLPFGSVLGPSVLLAPLAAAVLGRLERFSVIIAASVGLGVVEQTVVWHTGQSRLVDLILFVIVLVALFLPRDRGTRADDVRASTWPAAAEVRPVPRVLARLPEVRWTSRGLRCGLLALAVAVPLVLPVSRVHLVGAILIFGVIGLSLVVLTGWAGQVSLGQMAFVGAGAVASGALTVKLGWDLTVSILAAGTVGAAAAAVIGLCALRIRGLYFTVATLAFAVATSSYLFGGEFSWLPVGAVPRGELLGSLSVDSETRYYYLALAGLLFALWALRGLRRSRSGRTLIATRENERAAAVAGISPARTKLAGFVISGFLAAYAGALFVHHQQALLPDSFSPAQSMQVLTMVVVGGLGSVSGALLGAAFVYGLTWLLPADLSFLAFLSTGAGTLLVLLVFPGGFGGLVELVRERFLRRVAARHAIAVPSLAADTHAGERFITVDPGDGGTSTGAGSPHLLRVRDLDVHYGGTQVLFGVDFDVERGEIVALLGTNGAGKSTLLRAISGVVEARAGSVIFDGEDITYTPAHEVAALGVIQVPGGRGVFPTLSVEENLRIAAWLYRRDGSYVRDATLRVLRDFPVLHKHRRRSAGSLSGGEQQMLTLAQALIANPTLLMIDELSLGLAPVVVEQLLAMVRAIRDQGTTVVLIEQSVNIALDIADTAYFMEKGEVRFRGAAADLLERPDLIRSVFLEGAGSVAPNGKVSRARLLSRDSAAGVRPTGGPVLEADGLGKSFGGVTAVDGVSFTLRPGEILGIIGPNGAGKTTVFDLVSGLLALDSGRVRLDGVDVTRARAHQRAWHGLGRSFQDARLFPALTVAESIAVYLERHVYVRDPLAAALRLPAARRSEAAVTARVDELIDRLGLDAVRDKYVSELSTGTRRIVDLACVLAHEPTVILFDEPSSGIAQRETEALAPLLLRIRQESGAAMLVIEHDMPLVTAVADELIALELGRVIARGAAAEVMHDEHVVASYLGSTRSAIARSGVAVLGAGPR